MNIQHLAKMLPDYTVHELTRTRKQCEVSGCDNKAQFYYTWEFPSYRDYFCADCKAEAEAINAKQAKLHQKALEAHEKAGGWLGEANRLREAGKDDSKALAKAQWWLDRLNKLEGNI